MSLATVLLLIVLPLLLALGLHWWRGRWLLSLTIPVLCYVTYLWIGGGGMYLFFGIFSLHYVLIGACAGALLARSLREFQRDEAANAAVSS